MQSQKRKKQQNQRKITRIEATEDRLTGRAGLALFVTYLSEVGLYPWIERWFGTIRKSPKGLGIVELFKQVLCFMADGTSRRLTRFDQLAKDDGYAGVIETAMGDMASSHQIKRFFNAFAWTRIFLFRRLLQKLFIWRLKLVRPAIIVLGLDTMVMDNDDAHRRHGVEPTYKGKKGFQPLQMNWGRYIVDAVFRGGSKHSNHGQTAQKMILHMVAAIRRHYSFDVPIIIRMDSGFFDQKIFELCESLQIGYICGGKMYKDIKKTVAQWKCENWNRFESAKKQAWEYAEFGSNRDAWACFRRAFYCRLLNIDRQMYLPGMRPDTVIVTNIGQGQAVDVMLKRAGAEQYLTADGIVAAYHNRGCDELANRALKDFGHEQLPFKRFNPNAAWYYTMLLGHFLLESFKEDVGAPVVRVESYATTVRRKLIDIAGKIVSHAGEIILKVSKACLEGLCLPELLQRCKCVTPIG